MMATNVTEKDKTLQEVIDWCTDWAKELCADIEGDYYANFLQADALARVIPNANPCSATAAPCRPKYPTKAKTRRNNHVVRKKTP